jgi:hypothetical protein
MMGVKDKSKIWLREMGLDIHGVLESREGKEIFDEKIYQT